jgi:hypothetical protein
LRFSAFGMASTVFAKNAMKPSLRLAWEQTQRHCIAFSVQAPWNVKEPLIP